MSRIRAAEGCSPFSLRVRCGRNWERSVVSSGTPLARRLRTAGASPRRSVATQSRSPRAMEAVSGHKPDTSQKPKTLALQGFSFVAGVGFEPTTFGL